MISKREAVVLASRLIATYLLIWALDAASYLPVRIYEYAHHAGPTSAVAGVNYISNLYLVDLVMAVVRVLGLALVSLLFFRASPGLQAFLLPASEREP